MHSIGQTTSRLNTITAENVQLFAALTGDYNPVHFDKAFAETTIFGKPIAHGPYVLTFITTVFANDLPGPGTVYLSHNIKFLKPAYIGDTVRSVVTITDITVNNHIIVSTQMFNQHNDLIIDGNARLKKM